jgi:hypothetical protein
MRGVWIGLGLLAILVVGLVGCHAPEPVLRPPKQPDQFTPPPDEKRFQLPPDYPKDVLNKDLQRKKDQADGTGTDGFQAGAGGPRGARPGAQ